MGISTLTLCVRLKDFFFQKFLLSLKYYDKTLIKKLQEWGNINVNAP